MRGLGKKAVWALERTWNIGVHTVPQISWNRTSSMNISAITTIIGTFMIVYTFVCQYIWTTTFGKLSKIMGLSITRQVAMSIAPTNLEPKNLSHSLVQRSVSLKDLPL